MSAFSDDYTRLEAFQTRAGLPLAEENVPLTVLEWTRGHAHGQQFRVNSIADLTARSDQWNLRVMYVTLSRDTTGLGTCLTQIRFAPLDLPNRDICKGFLALFDHYGFPSGFLSERIQSVGHSFGAKTDEVGAQCKYSKPRERNIICPTADTFTTFLPKRLLVPFSMQEHQHRAQQQGTRRDRQSEHPNRDTGAEPGRLQLAACRFLPPRRAV